MRRLNFTLFFLLINLTAYGAYSGDLPKLASMQTRWVFSRADACLDANNITRVAADGECLAIQTYLGDVATSAHPILVVFIHGDGIPGGGPSDYLKYQATHFTAPDVVPIVMIRPGYYDSYGHYSTGESYAFSAGGYPEDSYRPHTVATLAAAVKQLKTFYHARGVILVGHSGGGIMSGIILGNYPDLANGAVLASVVGDVQRWAKKHSYGDFSHSLSPNHFVHDIPKHDFVYVGSGTKDNNTYTNMAHHYYQQLKAAGVQAFWYPEVNGTHNSIVLTKVSKFDAAIKAAIERVRHQTIG